MRRTRIRDEIVGVPVAVHFWRWGWFRYPTRVEIGRMEAHRPTKLMRACMIALQVVMIWASLDGQPPAPMNDPAITFRPPTVARVVPVHTYHEIAENRRRRP